MSSNSPTGDNSQNDQDQKVYEAEVVEDYNSSNGYRRHSSQAYSNNNLFSYYSVNNGGCAAALITFFLFIICLGQYGLLAAIGFIVFKSIGSVISTIYAGRALALGQPFSVWGWRIANWFISLLLTIWLAGGLNP